MHEHQTIIDITFLMASGWVISLQDIETAARICSLIVPTVLSVLLFIRNQKKHNKTKKDQ